MKYDLYAVIGSEFCRDKTLEGMVMKAIVGGVDVIQLREKNAKAVEYIKTARKIGELTRWADAGFIVNDRVDVALAVDADGVHLGQGDLPIEIARRILGPDKIIGISVQTLSQALEARDAGADYLGVGPVFSTSSKDDTVPPIGIPVLKQICREANIPVVAIGGINSNNVKEVLGAGANGVAVISAIFSTDDVKMSASGLKGKIEALKGDGIG